MLSVCIPVYQFEIEHLVKHLVNEIEHSGMQIEILIYDDHSNNPIQKKNRQFISKPYIFYQELPHNIGRSSIRNLLAKAAKYDYLLFLDCDVIPAKDSFLENYYSIMHMHPVIYGGTAYQPIIPDDPELIFHWRYGKAKEEMTTVLRTKHPYLSFKTNNFLVQKDIFLTFPLEEELQGYGHEDSLFAFSLREHKIPIKHLGNPVIHLGLIPAFELIGKLESSLNNLVLLENIGKPVPVKIYRWYKCLKWIRALPYAKQFIHQQKKQCRNKLQSAHVSLRVLDFYKLFYLLDQ